MESFAYLYCFLVNWIHFYITLVDCEWCCYSQQYVFTVSCDVKDIWSRRRKLSRIKRWLDSSLCIMMISLVHPPFYYFFIRVAVNNKQPTRENYLLRLEKPHYMTGFWTNEMTTICIISWSLLYCDCSSFPNNSCFLTAGLFLTHTAMKWSIQSCSLLLFYDWIT